MPICAIEVAIQSDRNSSDFSGAQASAVNRGTRGFTAPTAGAGVGAPTAAGKALESDGLLDMLDMIGHTRGSSSRWERGEAESMAAWIAECQFPIADLKKSRVARSIGNRP